MPRNVEPDPVAAESSSGPEPAAVDPAGKAGPPPPAAGVEPLPAAPELGSVDAAIASGREDVVAIRRRLHAAPELGERENETSALVVEQLRAYGLEIRTGIGKTGVVGVLKGGEPGPTIAWRADMDALPITERTGLPFASEKKDTYEGQSVGVMHACGHDMHTAIALGIARVLAKESVRARIRGSVVFVFQPAEEGVPEPGAHGAELMLAEGVFDSPRPAAILGLHVHPDHDVGEVAVRAGGIMAATDRFEVEIDGKQSHGAYPQQSVDPIVTASQVVMALQTIASRNVDTRDTVVLTVGKVAAGNRFNIIPSHAELVGTVRTHDEGVQALVHRRMADVVDHVARGFGATARLHIDKLTPVTYNDPELLGRLQGVLAVATRDRVVETRPNMAGEDFAYYTREVPGVLYFLGVSRPGAKAPAALHTPEFNPDEGALEVGVRTGAYLLLSYLHGSAA